MINRSGEIIKAAPFQSWLPSGSVARVEPNRKWFGNTRVITQTALQNFQEEMAKVKMIHIKVVMKQTKLPITLLNETAKHARVHLLDTESFETTFGKKAQRKRPNIKIDDLTVISHMRAVLSDPGIVPLPKNGLDFSDLHAGRSIPNTKDGWSVCNKCETYRPPRAHHCRICRRCIRKMDHHCPWINNCVGELNQKYFIQFLFYVGMASCYATTMVITSWVMDPNVTSTYKHTKLIHSVILIVECVLFGMFVIAIGCDQISSILGDETQVEQVKKEGIRREKKSMYSLLQEVFGRGHPLGWLCPLFTEASKERPSKQYIV
ncbi:ZDHHC3_7_25 [Mytilus edulis]|uniref:Palmitoyltransferase n=1 Tax=Mytilus edulis TaxID=6550 RepID=A0A8S3T2A9_MYTED|nr:ZDHHC3_7_25 [Mytilus edulis]